LVFRLPFAEFRIPAPNGAERKVSIQLPPDCRRVTRGRSISDTPNSGVEQAVTIDIQ
jgi:hypothetical protein